MLKSFNHLLLGLLFLSSLLMAQDSNLPNAQEARFVESSGPSEVVIVATGLATFTPKHFWNKPDQNELTEGAKLDARRSAVHFILLGGSDPMLTTAEEISKFKGVQESFFSTKNVQKFIAWESDRFEERVKLNEGNSLRIKRVMRLNTRLIRESLVDLGVLVAKADLATSLGLPNIMVLPDAPKGKNPLDLMRNDATLKKGAEVIESYLTARRYDVLAPDQASGVNDLVSASQSLKDVSEDASYMLALSVGADVYITYNITTESRKVGSTTVKKAAVGVRAYETTTARLLGTETGYSVERPSMDAVVIEEGINDAIEKVLARINAYWKEDLNRGVQYKVIISIATDYDLDDAENTLFSLTDALAKMSKSTKEVLLTDYTLDYLIWVDPATYQKSSDIYRDIKKTMDRILPDGKLQRVTMNRKLVVLKITRE
ncbi:MAG: hypothetical protein ISR87_13340 [Candidatus Marinimicrobia bacterium]|nr:hypothetical protein [FCB group bacterium]MBL7026426.1 hypothetical protein [Candidatus Neomarinimicrobiota bacterium]